MKILKEGIKDMENSMRVICTRCQAELEINSDDIIKVDDCRTYYLKCPCCNRKIPVYEGNIPRNMLWKIDLREAK